MFEIWQARHAEGPLEAGPAYAIKRPRTDLESDALAVLMLRREARAAQAAAHPHLMPVLAHHLREAPHFLVMPWLEGHSLEARIRTSGKVPLGLAFFYLRQTAEALDALHRARFLHGDLKPANIHLSPQGHATLLDLGFASALDERELVGPEVAGTPDYLAPERLHARLQPDARADFYSLGVTLFRLLTGKLPREASAAPGPVSALEAMRALRRACPQAPKQSVTLIGELLAIDPLRRPASATEIIRRLIELEISTLTERS